MDLRKKIAGLVRDWDQASEEMEVGPSAEQIADAILALPEMEALKLKTVGYLGSGK